MPLEFNQNFIRKAVDLVYPAYVELLIETELNEDEDFELRVRQAFKRGIHRVYAKKMYEFCKEEIGDRDEVAEFFGLKSGSTISHQQIREAISGENLSMLLHAYSDRVSWPTITDGARSGYLEAINHVFNNELLLAIGNAEEIPEDEFDHLWSSLADARAKPINTLLEMRQVALAGASGHRVFGKGHPGDDVLDAAIAKWGKSFVLGVCAVPIRNLATASIYKYLEWGIGDFEKPAS